MGRRLKFEFEFEDGGPSSLEYQTVASSERASISLEEVPVLYVNKGACNVLAQVFGKLAMGSHVDGFHLHLGENLDPDLPEILRIVLNSQYPLWLGQARKLPIWDDFRTLSVAFMKS